MRIRFVKMFAIALILAVTLLAAEAELTAGSVVASGPCAVEPCGADGTDTAIQELADRYAPIVMLKAQKEPCDSAGEAYAPVAVDLVLDNPAVALRNAGSGEVVQGPTVDDLFEKPEGYYLDFPNSPKRAGCSYERDFRALSPTIDAVAYAHVARQDGHEGFALQYWLYYYFNDWNNNHESDFEMIQLIFEVDSVEEALAQGPVRVGYSQHGGGEHAEWDSGKLEREGDHPVVWVASGSHSNQFENKNYIGRAEEKGVGFGCDDASGKSVRMETRAIVVPTSVDSIEDDFGWVSYEGRWGEQLSGEFNGPTGPNTKRAWTKPFDWQDDLRSSNVEVPAGKTAGPSPVNAFCGVVAYASNTLLPFVVERPWFTLITALVVGGAFVTTAVRTNYDLIPVPLRRKRRFGQIIRGALFTVRKRLFLFLGLSAAFIPAGMIASGLEALIFENPPVESVLDLSDPPKAVSILIGATVGVAVFGIAYGVAIAGITTALAQMESGEDVSIMGAYKALGQRARHLLHGRLRALGIVLLLAFSVVGLPWAIRRSVQWLFIEQAILFDGADGRGAASASARVVDGKWLRALLISSAFTMTGFILGPLITAPLLLFTSTPLNLLNALSSLIYMLVVPVVAVGLAMLYFDLKETKAEAN